MGCRRDRDQLLRYVQAEREARFVYLREPGAKEPLVHRAHIEVNVPCARPASFGDDRAAYDVARGKLEPLIVSLHKPLTGPVSQYAAFPAHRLAEKESGSTFK